MPSSRKGSLEFGRVLKLIHKRWLVLVGAVFILYMVVNFRLTKIPYPISKLDSLPNGPIENDVDALNDEYFDLGYDDQEESESNKFKDPQNIDIANVEQENGDKDKLHMPEPDKIEGDLKADEMIDGKLVNQDKVERDEKVAPDKQDKIEERAVNKMERDNLDNQDKKVESENREQEVVIPKLVFGGDGPGQRGEGTTIDKDKLTKEERELYDRGFKRNDFNEYLSDLISVDRSPPDIHHPECLTKIYPADLPDTSVIITFLNEAFSVLVRSVHSVINQSPPHLLREIILVDDFSDYDTLKEPLKKHMERFAKVKIVRNTRREGLIRARLIGAAMATGNVLTFLDSHIECASGWLEPLLARIQENRSHVVWPSIPAINGYSFKFNVNEGVTIGGFTWTMLFSWIYPPVKDRESDILPTRSPTMPGGLFSIDKEYFYHIGSYDDQMTFWGADNIEISFRIWMCGGTVEIIPCSVVGHIYRNRNVNTNINNNGASRRNTLRTAMVWMDEYKHLYFNVANVQPKDYGNITARLELRKKLKCKSFEWYLDNVYTESFRPNNALRSGLLHSVANTSRCLESGAAFHSSLQTGPCNKMAYRQQLFYETSFVELRTIAYCVDAGLLPRVITYECSRSKGNQEIRIQQDGSIYVPLYKKCLEWLTPGNEIQLRPCDKNNSRQLWKWEDHQVDFMKKN